MVILVTFDFLIGGGLIAGLVAAATRMRSARVLAGKDGNLATARRVGRSGRVVAVLSTVGSVLALLVFVNVVYFKSANRVIGSPTRAQVTGTWVGNHGSTLVLRPDGTFTAYGLPQHVGTVAAVTSSADGPPLNPWSGHGTWIIGPGGFNGSPESVIFTVACDPPNRCAGHARTFDLQQETNAPAGGGGRALFYYLSNPHDLSNQYPFVRGQ
jgi:hypothetical protein